MKVLLTGGSGFIATHCLDKLLAHGHQVVTTVRSADKGKYLLNLYSGRSVSYSIVKDIAEPGAFDAVIKNDSFEAVVHTASPFHYRVTDNKRDMLDPAIEGTTSVLKAVKAYGPTVKRVVITSSFSAMVNVKHHPEMYNEDCWNPITMEEALNSPDAGVVYDASKKFAEEAAWRFMTTEKPDFDLVTLNPPWVFGPVNHVMNSVDDLNESNKRILGQGGSGSQIWIDVRDLAEAHALALEVADAGNKRIFVTAGHFSSEAIREVIDKAFPDLSSKIDLSVQPNLGGFAYEFDNSRSTSVLGLQYRSLHDCVVDTINSIRSRVTI